MHCVSWKLVAGRMPGNLVHEPPNGAFLLFLFTDWGLTHILCDSPASEYFEPWNWIDFFKICLAESRLHYAKSTSLIVSFWVGARIFIDFYRLARVSSHQNGESRNRQLLGRYTRTLTELVSGRIFTTTLHLIICRGKPQIDDSPQTFPCINKLQTDYIPIFVISILY